MKRRSVAVAAGGSALASPWAVRAQRPAMPVIGFLSGVSRTESESRVAAFRRGLEQAGYSEGRNLSIEFRFAGGDYARLQSLAAELVRLPVDLLLAAGIVAAVAIFLGYGQPELLLEAVNLRYCG